jgi:hypothetical protein
MPFSLQLERLPDFVLYRVAGPASLVNYSDLIDEAARQTRADGDKRAVVDLRGVIGRLYFSDQYFIGELVTRKLAHLERLATVVPEDPSSYHSEKVANRHGFQLRGFLDENDAFAWLRER